jgi:hypothetical protein
VRVDGCGVNTGLCERADGCWRVSGVLVDGRTDRVEDDVTAGDSMVRVVVARCVLVPAERVRAVLERLVRVVLVEIPGCDSTVAVRVPVLAVLVRVSVVTVRGRLPPRRVGAQTSE